MNAATGTLSQRERELAAIISAYNEVTEKLKASHESLNHEVQKLRLEIEDKNQELARRERLSALGEMATGVAHEIRNPLGGIRLYASLLERDLSVLPKSQALVRKIACGVEALDKIVGEVLDFAGRHDPDAKSVLLRLMISNVFETAAPQARSKGVRLVMDDFALSHEVWVDQSQLERAILNVVLNGIDAVSKGGTVSVSAEAAEEGVVALSVSDDGSGVDASLMERIFNPFFTTKDTGTGLGLAIVHRVLESHGGRISVCNRQKGGACFTMYLPTDPRRFDTGRSKGAA